MNAAVVELMNATGHCFPTAHRDAALMAALAADVQRMSGFENFGLPFCMTVEAEVLGSEVDYGTLSCEPKIAREAVRSVEDLEFLPRHTMEKSGRVGLVAEAIRLLAREQPDIPVIGSVSGPLSTAASLVDPMTFLKELRKNPQGARRVVDYVTDQLIDYALVLVESGASVISIADPTATGEILGPRFFSAYALPAINKIVDALHARGVPVIVHICGNTKPVEALLAELRGDALSVDAMVNLAALKAEIGRSGDMAAMGNVSTYLLEFGNEEAVAQVVGFLRERGIDIIAPACGLSTSTPLRNIRALTGAAKEVS
jgi:[methyl-Co(III) methanol-specific corrinoid protein]:coenzyme M methyltransferase